MTNNQKLNQVSPIILIVVGIVLMIWGGGALATIATIVVILFLIEAVVFLVNALQSKNASDWAGCGVFFVIGLLLAFHPGAVISIFPILIGLSITLSSIGNLVKAFQGGSAGTQKLIGVIVNVVIAVIGIYVMFHPFSTMSTMLRISGFLMVIDGISAMLSGSKKA